MNAQNQMKIAVMDFKAGVGVNQADTEGLSDMLINTLFKTGKFEIIERTQIDQARKELKFQETEPTYEQIAQMGRFLGVESVLIGTVNKLFDEYNVDVRAIDVESAKVVTTAGRSLSKKTASAFRRMTEKLGKELAENLIEEKPVIKVVEEKNKVTKPEKVHFRKSGFTFRPEVGLNFPLGTSTIMTYNNWYNNHTVAGYCGVSYAVGPSVELAIGYQVGSHFFFGVIGGYGGRINGFYDDINLVVVGYSDDIDQTPIVQSEKITTMEYTTHSFPIKTDIRWYLIDHEYSFLVDLQAGLNSYKYRRDDSEKTSGVFNERGNENFNIKLGIGFAVRNVEITLAWNTDIGPTLPLKSWDLNVAYRFGTNTSFKDLKWW